MMGQIDFNFIHEDKKEQEGMKIRFEVSCWIRNSWWWDWRNGKGKIKGYEGSESSGDDKKADIELNWNDLREKV